MHLDGARIWNACVADQLAEGKAGLADLQSRLAEYATHFDSVSVCLSKGLGGCLWLGLR